MTTYKRGEVILVPFPFSDQSITKKRPAVIISSDDYTAVSSDIVIMAITSQIDHLLNIGEKKIENWKSAGLLKPSAIKSAVSTLEKKMVIKNLGRFSSNDLDNLNDVLKELLGL